MHTYKCFGKAHIYMFPTLTLDQFCRMAHIHLSAKGFKMLMFRFYLIFLLFLLIVWRNIISFIFPNCLVWILEVQTFTFFSRETNSMVEEFMLLANISVAQKIYDEFSECALLRKHPSPPPSNYDILIKAAKSRVGGSSVVSFIFI